MPYSHDFHSNAIGVGVQFYHNYNGTEGYKFYDMYGRTEKTNWIEKTAYEPTAIAKEFRTGCAIDPPRCLKVVMSIGNSHKTRVPIEIQDCSKESKKECRENSDELN